MLIKSQYQKVHLSTQQNQTLQIVLNKIKTKEYMLVDIPCICGNKTDDEVITNTFYPNFINSEMNVVICKHCGTLRTTPYLSENAISEFYTHDYRLLYGSDELSAEKKFKQSCKGSLFSGTYSYNFLKPHVEKYKKSYNKTKLKIFEIGCGYGEVLYNFHNDGEDVYGCDYGIEGLNIAKEKGMQNMFVGDVNVLKPHGTPDVIIINHVLEHIVNLKAFFSKLKELISKDTLVYVGVPSISSIGFFYKSDSRRHFQIAHVWHFSNNTLDAVMLKEGFEKIESNEVIQSIYKHTGETKNISLISEYQKNKILLQTFDRLYTKQLKLKIYKKYTVALAIVSSILLLSLAVLIFS